MITFTMVAAFLSRRLAFLGALLLSMFVTMFVFQSLHSASDAYWMLPMMGFAQLAVFAGVFDLLSGALSDAAARYWEWASVTTRCVTSRHPAPILFGYLATHDVVPHRPPC